MPVADRQTLSALWIELHVHELAAYHGWPIARARKVVTDGVNSGVSGFWNHDPAWFWPWQRSHGR